MSTTSRDAKSDADVLLTLEEAASYLHVGESTLRAYIADGRIAATKFGRRVLFKRSVLVDFVNSHTSTKEQHA